jgi:hypothetical protein
LKVGKQQPESQKRTLDDASVAQYYSLAHLHTCTLARLELGEMLASRGVALLVDLEDVEANGLGKGTALTNSNHIAVLDAHKGRRAMGREVLVSLLVAVVLLDIVQVLATDDNGAFHLCGDNDARQDASAN